MPSCEALNALILRKVINHDESSRDCEGDPAWIYVLHQYVTVVLLLRIDVTISRTRVHGRPVLHVEVLPFLVGDIVSSHLTASLTHAPRPRPSSRVRLYM